MDVLPESRGRRRVGALLLTCLFIMKAAADCPKPQSRGNSVLTNEALLMNDFPGGSNVSFECANGYVQERGDGIAVCADGLWSEPDLVCRKKDCGPPRPQPNMSFNISTGTLFTDVIKVVCEKGYQVSGSSYKQCYASGWTGRAKCEIVTCDPPAEIAHGIASWGSQDDPKYGETVQYVCNAGYAPFGNGSIVCGETGEYDSQPPECKEDRSATDKVGPRSTPPAKVAPTSIATPTGPRDKAITTSSAPTGSPLAHTDSHDRFAGYMPFIVAVICVSLAFCIVAIVLSRFLLRRKGSTSSSSHTHLSLPSAPAPL
ncbi:complement decay-accelerating factor [Brachionichthys hirsutus]|uniref:complement decay-accelerating factor n=1 Tax=Brachionichthys hirsutus TaxID=412623 RepID=UPI0036044731